MVADAPPPSLQITQSSTKTDAVRNKVTANGIETLIKLSFNIRNCFFSSKQQGTTKIAIIPRASHTHQSSSLSLPKKKSLPNRMNQIKRYKIKLIMRWKRSKWKGSSEKENQSIWQWFLIFRYGIELCRDKGFGRD